MEPLTLLRGYVAMNVALLIAWLLMVAARRIGDGPDRITFRARLVFGQLASLAVLVVPSFAILPGETYLPEVAQVWSAPSMRAAAPPSSVESFRISLASTSAGVGFSTLAGITVAILIAGALVALTRIGVGLIGTLRIVRASHLLRRRGSLYIVTGDTFDVPFSFWVPGRHYVALPSSLLAHPGDLKLALRHEAQHHRQGDTRMVYLLQTLLGLCFLNPAAYLFARRMRELHEFACDEAVVRQRRVSATAYCNCLTRIAEQAHEQRAALVCTSMTEIAQRPALLRRIEIMLERPMHEMRAHKVVSLATVGFALLSMTAVAMSAAIKDRRITHDDAQRMAAVARSSTSFPIVVNDSVVQALNRYLGTPDGRTFIRDSLGRMQAHRELIDAKLVQYALPKELLAVPLVESGYRNLSASNIAGHGAGLWMFIEPTARRYSLRVDAESDERLNVASETDAAMRMFSDLHRQFGDWGLVLLAYNSGSALVEQGIRETGSRDVWTMVAQGYENDRDYLPRMMAAILIMQNPDVVN